MARLRIAACLALTAAGVCAQGQEAKPAQPFIRTTGEATASAKPDEVSVNLGVVTQAQTAQAAAAQNAKQLDAVVSQVRKTFGAAAELKTIGYSVHPDYRYPKQGGQPEITGYTASNILEVKLSDISQAGKLVDLATQSGANSVQSLRYGIKDEAALHARALREAATAARAKADAMAAALGLRITRVLAVEEAGSNTIRPFAPMAMAARAEVATPTPLESGSIEAHATVTLTIEVAQ